MLKITKVSSKTTAEYPMSGTIYECETVSDLLEACQALKDAGLSDTKLHFALQLTSFEGLRIFVADQPHYNGSGECLESYDFCKVTMEAGEFSDFVSDEDNVVMRANEIVLWEETDGSRARRLKIPVLCA